MSIRWRCGDQQCWKINKPWKFRHENFTQACTCTRAHKHKLYCYRVNGLNCVFIGSVSRDRLIFNMGIPIPGKDGLYNEMEPWMWLNTADCTTGGVHGHRSSNRWCHWPAINPVTYNFLYYVLRWNMHHQIRDKADISTRASSCNLNCISHYLNQCWVIINWTLRNKLQRNCNQSAKFPNRENASENVLCAMASILSRGDD